jgi:hypothetical protein
MKTMAPRQRSWVVGIAVAALLVLSSVARADAIDGEWCYTDGRHMAIQGPRIVTPGGTEMKGDYGRHSFSYIVPEGEPDAGRGISMILVDEYTVHLRADADPAGATPPEVEVWRRCTPRMS